MDPFNPNIPLYLYKILAYSTNTNEQLQTCFNFSNIVHSRIKFILKATENVLIFIWIQRFPKFETNKGP